MRELERTLRASAPTAERVDPGLEDRIWAAFSHDHAAAPAAPFAPFEPQLVVDDSSPSTRPSRLAVVLGMLAAAAILVAAVVIAGLRDEGSVPADGTPTATAPAPDPAAQVGQTYPENSCPDPDRGACFEPFPAGRYTFHKANPQVTLTVGDGWRVDGAWPWGTVLTRADTPGASLEILNDAHLAGFRGCDLSAVAGESHDAVHLVTALTQGPNLASSGLATVRVGGLPGYRTELEPTADAPRSPCHGVPTLMAPASDANGGGQWSLDLGPDMRMRVDAASTSLDRTVVVAAVVKGTRDDLESWLRVAQPVIDSLTFRPCAPHLTFSQPCVFPPASSP
jgi:hypothetical protein